MIDSYGNNPVGIIWPGFIAACEAKDEDLRAQLIGWFDRSGRRSGLRNFLQAADVVKRVWNRRYDRGDDRMHWMDVLKKDNLTLVPTRYAHTGYTEPYPDEGARTRLY